MSFEELAEKYAQKITQETDKNKAAIEIKHEIDSLIYSDSKKDLSQEHKLQILQLVTRKLETQRRLLLENGNFSQQLTKIAAASNEEAIKAISTIIQTMGGLQ